MSKAFLPSPFDKMLIIVQAVLLGLGSLILRRIGAAYVAMVGGFLTALFRPAFFPFTLFFALLYGLFVDFLFFIFKVNLGQGTVKTGRLMTSMTLSTGFTGFLSYHVSVLFELLPRNFALEVSVLATGTLSGAVAGYLVAVIWNKHLKNTRF
ncbi:MAG: hypothetical protein RMJ15_02900 [Nitrososphaerota archaeon]|nr:hypothetical protein [Nitrososphaerota archaeon]